MSTNLLTKYVKLRANLLKLHHMHRLGQPMPADIHSGHHYIANLTDVNGRVVSATFKFNKHTYDGNHHDVRESLAKLTAPDVHDPMLTGFFDTFEDILERIGTDGDDSHVVIRDIGIRHTVRDVRTRNYRGTTKEFFVNNYKTLDDRYTLHIISTDRWYDEKTLQQGYDALVRWATSVKEEMTKTVTAIEGLLSEV